MALVRQKMRVKAVIHLLEFPGLGLTRVLNPAVTTFQTDQPQSSAHRQETTSQMFGYFIARVARVSPLSSLISTSSTSAGGSPEGSLPA